MYYTLANGARNYNSKLHYSLYGGVEYYPDRSLAWKELLPLAAIPAVAITLLVAIINFHVPAISTPSGAGESLTPDGSANGSNAVTSSLILPSTDSSGNSTSTNNSGATGSATNALSNAPMSPVVQDTVNGVTGGMGGGETTGGSSGGGGGTTVTTPPTGGTTVTDPTGTTPSLLNVNASVDESGVDTSVDATVPIADTSLSASVGVGL